MKYLILLVALYSFISVSAQHKPLPFTTDTIAIAEAKAHFGSYKTICGTLSAITKTSTSIEEAYLITVSDGAQMTLVVWASDADNWNPPFGDWLQVEDQVCVQGQIISYGDQPRMEIGNQGQIHK